MRGKARSGTLKPERLQEFLSMNEWTREEVQANMAVTAKSEKKVDPPEESSNETEDNASASGDSQQELLVEKKRKRKESGDGAVRAATPSPTPESSDDEDRNDGDECTPAQKIKRCKLGNEVVTAETKALETEKAQ